MSKPAAVEGGGGAPVRWKAYLGLTVAVILVWFALHEISRAEQYEACQRGCGWVCGEVYDPHVSGADPSATPWRGAAASECFWQHCEEACLRYTRAFEAFDRHRRARLFVAWVKQKLGSDEQAK
jgi:hypothetical protein